MRYIDEPRKTKDCLMSDYMMDMKKAFEKNDKEGFRIAFDRMVKELPQGAREMII